MQKVQPKRQSSSAAMANNQMRTKSTNSSHSRETIDTMMATIIQLRSDLESERRCARKLRRERATNAHMTQDQSRANSTSAALRDTVARLRQEKERETSLLLSRQKTEIDRIVKEKDKEIRNLRKDLVKCRDDLREVEESHRCGLSASARVAFELERTKLLQDIRELSVSKRQLKEALCSAAESAKQKSLELQKMQDIMKVEISKVNREANVEIKRILDELRTRDQFLTDGGNRGKKSPLKCPQLETQLSSRSSSTTEIESWKRNLSSVEESLDVVKCGRNLSNFSLQRSLYDLEKQLKYLAAFGSRFTEKNDRLKRKNKEQEQRISSVIEQNRILNSEMRSAKGEVKRLKDLMNASGIKDLTSTLEDFCRQIKDYESKANSRKEKIPKKMVRFQLVENDQEISGDDDGGGGIDEGGGGGKKEEGHSIEQSHQAAIATSEILYPEDWQIQQESLNIVIQTLEDKLKKCEENEEKLSSKLTESRDQNEELEFQILELENSADEKRSLWQKESESLKAKLSNLEHQLKLIKDESNNIMERTVATQCDLEIPNGERRKQQTVFNELTDDDKLSAMAKTERSTDILPPKSTDDMADNASAREISNSTGVTSNNTRPQDAAEEESEVDGDLSDDGSSPMAREISRTQVESLRQKLVRSRIRELQTKDQLMLLEEEKNRHIKLLQNQIECLENHDPILESSPRLARIESQAIENERPNPEGLEARENFEPVVISGVANREHQERSVRLKLDTTLHWIPGPIDVFSSTPLSGDCNLARRLELCDSRQEQLCRQISDLERDREILQEIVHSKKSTICELRSEVGALQQSEKDLRGIVGRLEDAEEQLRAKADTMAVYNADMELQLKDLRDAEDLLRSNLKKSESIEQELKSRIEEMTEEKYASDSGWKRRLSEVEIEKKMLWVKVDELEDQVGELEGVECALKQKLKRKEKTEIGLNSELKEIKQDFTAAINHITDLEYEREFLIEKLEKVAADLTAETIRRHQEKEAMSIDAVEFNRRIKVLEQSVSRKEAAISSLEIKLLELESDKMETLENHSQNFLKQQSELQSYRGGFSRVTDRQLEDFGECSCDECVDEGRPLDDVKTSSVSIRSSRESLRDAVESADEASEIVDEDDGAKSADHWKDRGIEETRWESWSASLSSGCKNRSTDSPTLDSVCDSGMESLKQDQSVQSVVT